MNVARSGGPARWTIGWIVCLLLVGCRVAQAPTDSPIVDLRPSVDVSLSAPSSSAPAPSDQSTAPTEPTVSASWAPSPSEGPSPTSPPSESPAVPSIAPPPNGATARVDGWSVEWTRVRDPDLEGPFSQYPREIVAFGSGYVILGEDAIPLGGGDADRISVFWISDDGRTWDEVPLTAGIPPSEHGTAFLLIAGPNGLVAAGGMCCTSEEHAIWRSTDARSWERVPLGAEVFGAASIRDGIATDDGTYVLAGQVQGHPAIWASPDGETWERVTGRGPGFDRGSIESVERFGDGLIAVGRDDSRPTYDIAVWLSDDGREWERVGRPEPAAVAGADEAELYSVVVGEGRLVGAGGSGSSEDRQACERLAVASSPGSEGGALDLSCGWAYDTLWTSVDGRAWVRLESPPPGRHDEREERHLISFRAMTAVDDVFANVGTASGGTVGLWIGTGTGEFRPTQPLEQLGPEDSVRELLYDGSELLAVGTSGFTPEGGYEENAAIWVGRLTRP